MAELFELLAVVVEIETRDAIFCQDCTMVLANGDASGIEDADLHLALMRACLPNAAGIYGPADVGFSEQLCCGCATFTFADQWFAGWIEEEG